MRTQTVRRIEPEQSEKRRQSEKTPARRRKASVPLALDLKVSVRRSGEFHQGVYASGSSKDLLHISVRKQQTRQKIRGLLWIRIIRRW